MDFFTRLLFVLVDSLTYEVTKVTHGICLTALSMEESEKIMTASEITEQIKQVSLMRDRCRHDLEALRDRIDELGHQIDSYTVKLDEQLREEVPSYSDGGPYMGFREAMEYIHDSNEFGAAVVRISDGLVIERGSDDMPDAPLEECCYQLGEIDDQLNARVSWYLDEWTYDSILYSRHEIEQSVFVPMPHEQLFEIGPHAPFDYRIVW